MPIFSPQGAMRAAISAAIFATAFAPRAHGMSEEDVYGVIFDYALNQEACRLRLPVCGADRGDSDGWLPIEGWEIEPEDAQPVDRPPADLADPTADIT